MIKEMVAKFKQKIDEDPRTQEFIAEIKKAKDEIEVAVKPVSQEKLQEIINKFKIK